MIMGPRLRKFALIVHVTVSVGWIGAVAAFLVLDVATVTRQDEATLRAAYIAMQMVTWWSIVPLSVASLLTGLLMSWGTKWGFFRHYWVVLSLVLTIIAVVVLMQQLSIIDHRAAVALDPATSVDDLRGLGSLLLHSIGGMVVLVIVLVLNVYKPKGLTRYGWRKTKAARTV